MIRFLLIHETYIKIEENKSKVINIFERNFLINDSLIIHTRNTNENNRH